MVTGKEMCHECNTSLVEVTNQSMNPQYSNTVEENKLHSYIYNVVTQYQKLNLLDNVYL